MKVFHVKHFRNSERSVSRETFRVAFVPSRFSAFRMFHVKHSKQSLLYFQKLERGRSSGLV